MLRGGKSPKGVPGKAAVCARRLFQNKTSLPPSPNSSQSHLELRRAPSLLLLAPQPLLVLRHRLLVARLAAQPVGGRHGQLPGLWARGDGGHVEGRGEGAGGEAAVAGLLLLGVALRGGCGVG